MAVPQAIVSGSGTSPDGRLTVTKTADKDVVRPGGEDVTYTYRVRNNSGSNMYYYSVYDNRCGQMYYTGGLTGYYGDVLAPGATATFTCTQRITQDTTNTATVQFTDAYGYLSTASANVTVRLSGGTGTNTCKNLWFGSDYDASYGGNGALGTVNPATGASSTKFRITHADGYQMTGTAAMAVDPMNPNLIYYVPRDYRYSNVYGGLWVYNTETGTTSRAATNAATPDVVRLAAAPDGSLWSITATGSIYRWTSATGWQAMGGSAIQRKPESSGPTSLANVGSGDLAFDGLGNLWVIGADPLGGAYLYTASWQDLTDGGGTTFSEVGRMGNGWFNGLAFTENGKLYATADLAGTSQLYEVNINTGSATLIGNLNHSASDLGSCALPKPELRVTKEVDPVGGVVPGDTVTYTIKVDNIGTLPTTNTTLQDTLPSGVRYVAGSAKLNGVQVDQSATFPYLGPKLINSPDAIPGVIQPGRSAVITFQTTVNETITDTEICNQGLTSFVGADEAGVKSDDPNKPGGDDPTCTPVFEPKIEVEKTGSTRFLSETPMDVEYTYDVTTPGNEPLKDVHVTDDKCPVNAPNTPLAPVLAEGTQFNIGDTNRDNLLTPDETWQFTCTSTLTEPTRNTATATGTGKETGREVTDEDDWLVDKNPLAIDKRSEGKDGGSEIKVGERVDYSITVTNTSETEVKDVFITDALPQGVTYVPGTATKTYWTDGATAETRTGTYTRQLTASPLNTEMTQSFTIDENSGVPANAVVTGFKVTMSGTSNYFYRQDLGTHFGDPEQVSLTAQAPWGDWFAVDDGTRDADDNEFGTMDYGKWNPVTREGTASGSPFGMYTLDWADSEDSPLVLNDHQVGRTTVEIMYEYEVPAGRAQVVEPAEPSNPGQSPLTFVAADEGISLKPGESMTVTFQGLVGPDAADTVTNTASTNYNVEDTVTDNVPKPELNLRKTVGDTGQHTVPPQEIQPDGTAVIDYLITIGNTGDAGTTRPEIEDVVTVPDDFEIVDIKMLARHPVGETPIAFDENGRFVVPPDESVRIAPGGEITGHVLVTVRAKQPLEGPDSIDWDRAGRCDVEGVGAPTHGGMFNIANIADDADGPENNDACVPLEPPKQRVMVEKYGSNCDVGQESCLIVGAIFEIYDVDPRTTGAEPISEGIFQDESGRKFSSDRLMTGKDYWLVETKSPSGFELMPTPVRFHLSADGIILADESSGSSLIAVDDEDNFVIHVTDPTTGELPKAGGTGPAGQVALALILMGSGVLIHRKTSRRRRA